MNKYVLALSWSLSLIPFQTIALSPVDPTIPEPILPTPPPEPIQAAVKVSIGSIGSSIDNAAIRSVRKIVGHAVANGTVDTFVVTSPRNMGPIPIEGGLSFCAEAGFNDFGYQFMEFVDELVSIQPNNGTFYNIELADFCPISIDDAPDDDIACTDDAKICPDGSGVGRVPPSCEFAPCPAVNQEIDPTPPQSDEIPLIQVPK